MTSYKNHLKPAFKAINLNIGDCFVGTYIDNTCSFITLHKYYSGILHKVLFDHYDSWQYDAKSQSIWKILLIPVLKDLLYWKYWDFKYLSVDDVWKRSQGPLNLSVHLT